MNPDKQQQTRLGRVRAVASGLLAVTGAIFIATLLIPEPGAWLMLLRSIAEAALVGGLADWFAVTAVFRRPLRLPIPHTAIVPANKDRIGEGLARFLDRHFLTREVLIPEIRSLHIAQRAANWLANRRNATALAGEIARALPVLIRAIDDRQVIAFLARTLGAELHHLPVASLLGRFLQLLMTAGSHQRVLDSALDYARIFLAQNEERMLEAVAQRRRRWVPRTINREIARAMLRAAAELLEDLRNPDGAARESLLVAISAFAAELAASPIIAGSRSSILTRPEIRTWIAEFWGQARDLLLRDLAAPSSRIRRAIAAAVAAVGEALCADAEMRQRLDLVVETIAAEALPWRAELIRFVSEVVHQWEPRSFSNRIEAAVGADLQFIRINGTIVGGLVGGVLYAISLLAP
ncbi:MAG: DUF445 domain-containing protein [Alphaproteobacteria bacterium]|nr:DUF445 domain-containing protein [Alphaproteobacteria bacterium]